MQTMECIRERRSVRNYKPDPIPEDIIKEIIEAATHAPSSGNVQDWEFIVVKNPETKMKVAAAAWEQNFIVSAPVVLVVCSDLDRISAAYGSRGETLYSIQNTSAAIQNILLAAWEKEVGSCWIGAFNENKIRDTLVLPSNVRPLAIITLGYPAEVSKKPRRRDVKEVLHMERWE
ncbi:MAG: nitroreductase family protein [Candidatus Aenigmatarchaeota archaeon]|nr:MAG: nitroreductase family protein [Candidatus Aenigmarchaeota archaeon]